MKFLKIPYTKLSLKNPTIILKATVIASLVLAQFLFSATVAKIDNRSISLKELRDYLEIQMFVANQTKQENFFATQNMNGTILLQKYLNHLLFLEAAEKNKLSPKSRKVQEKLKVNKEEWMYNLFLSQTLDLFSVNIEEAAMRAEFKAIYPGDKQYESLTQLELRKLQQLVLMKISQKKKIELLESLKKKYDVKVNKPTNKVVFSIGKKNYSQSDFKNFFSSQLQKVGVSEDSFKEQDLKRYNSIKGEVLDEMVLQEIVKLEMVKLKFSSKKLVKKALNLYGQQLAIDIFIAEILTPKVKISDNELDLAFKELSEARPSIQKMLPSDQEKLLKSVILQQKMPEVIQDFIESRKEESSIKRYNEVLAQL